MSTKEVRNGENKLWDKTQTKIDSLYHIDTIIILKKDNDMKLKSLNNEILIVYEVIRFDIIWKPFFAEYTFDLRKNVQNETCLEYHFAKNDGMLMFLRFDQHIPVHFIYWYEWT